MTNSRNWEIGAALALAATAACFLGGRISFVPVPWADGSAFYLPGLDLINWPPQWRMHAQAAFVPSYDDANFNIMPGLPALLGIASRLGLGKLLDPPLMIRAVNLVGLLSWAFLMWKWWIEIFSTRVDSRKARISASVLAFAALWDPIMRWGTMAIRTEAWIGLGWVFVLREIYRQETADALGVDQGATAWPRAAWRISVTLALMAYFHFEAGYLVPATALALAWTADHKTAWSRLLGVAWRTASLLVPWIIYVFAHFGPFIEQMSEQLNRLSHFNIWMANPYMIFHSLFVDHGNATGWPKMFNSGKLIFWAVLFFMVGVAALFGRERKGHTGTLLAGMVGFASAFFLWATKPEIWFITLCHATYWPWVGLSVTRLWDCGRKRATHGLVIAAFAMAVISVIATGIQERKIGPGYTWTMYDNWVDCIERGLGPLADRPDLKLWQPFVPDVLVLLSARHPEWDLTRTLDLPGRTEAAWRTVKTMDAMVFTRHFNPDGAAALAKYEGEERDVDRDQLSRGIDLPFGPHALKRLPAEEPGRWSRYVCEYGPFWAEVIARK